MDQSDHDPAAGRSNRMPQSDSRAVHIGDLPIQTKLPLAGDVLSGEGFVHLDQVEIGNLEDRFFSWIFTAGTGERPMMAG